LRQPTRWLEEAAGVVAAPEDGAVLRLGLSAQFSLLQPTGFMDIHTIMADTESMPSMVHGLAAYTAAIAILFDSPSGQRMAGFFGRFESANEAGERSEPDQSIKSLPMKPRDSAFLKSRRSRLKSTRLHGATIFSTGNPDHWYINFESSDGLAQAIG
jgi:hypothetical protein